MSGRNSLLRDTKNWLPIISGTTQTQLFMANNHWFPIIDERDMASGADGSDRNVPSSPDSSPPNAKSSRRNRKYQVTEAKPLDNVHPNLVNGTSICLAELSGCQKKIYQFALASKPHEACETQPPSNANSSQTFAGKITRESNPPNLLHQFASQFVACSAPSPAEETNREHQGQQHLSSKGRQSKISCLNPISCWKLQRPASLCSCTSPKNADTAFSLTSSESWIYNMKLKSRWSYQPNMQDGPMRTLTWSRTRP